MILSDTPQVEGGTEKGPSGGGKNVLAADNFSAAYHVQSHSISICCF